MTSNRNEPTLEGQIIPTVSSDVSNSAIDPIVNDSTPTFHRSFSTLTMNTNASSVTSSETLINEGTSPTCAVNLPPYYVIKQSSSTNNDHDKSNRSEDRSVEVLRTKI